MLQSAKRSSWLLVLCIMLIGAASIGWYGTANANKYGTNQLDTVPKREKKMRSDEDRTIIKGDLDKTMQQLDRAMDRLKEQLESKDWQKVQLELQESMEKLNAEKVEEQISKALKDIDLQKIKMETQKELQKIDMDKMQKELQKALAEAKENIDSKKIQAEIEKAVKESKKALDEAKEFDMDKIKAELDNSKEELRLEQGKIKVEMENAKKEIREAMKRDFKKDFEKAQEDIKRAKEELSNYKNMLGEMEKEGLINTKEDYKVVYKNGELIINGKKQPASVTEKYKHYFKKDNVSIQKNDDDDDDKTIDL